MTPSNVGGWTGFENYAPTKMKPSPICLTQKFENEAKICPRKERIYASSNDIGQSECSIGNEFIEKEKDEMFREELLEDIEDTMEAVMSLADRVVRLSTKIKRSLRRRYN